MATIQQTIYNLEQGRWAAWLRWSVLIVAILILSFWLNLFQFRGFANPEAMDDAQIARELARGHGFTTQCIRPAALAQMRDHQFVRQGGILTSPDKASPLPADFSKIPDTSNPPVYPYILSELFKLSGVDFKVSPESLSDFHFYAPELLINGFNQLCLLLTALTVFLLGRALFDLRVALTAGAACLAGNLLWRFSLSGLPVSLTLLLVSLAALFLHRALRIDEEAAEARTHVWPWGSVLLGGLCLGLATLCQYTAAWLLLPFLFTAGLGLRARWQTIGALLLLWLILFTPWAVRNAGLTGDILGSNTLLLAATSQFYPGSSVERVYRFNPNVLIWKEGLHKAAHGLRYHVENVFRLLDTGLAPSFFLVGLIYFFRRRRAQFMRVFVLGGLLFLAFGTSLANPQPDPISLANAIFLLWPLVTLLGVAFFFILLDRFQATGPLRPWIIGLFLIANSLPFAGTLLSSSRGLFAYPPYFPPVLIYSAAWFEKEETVASDIPWAVAWYEDHPSLWIPATQKDFLEINDYVSPIRGLLFTPQSRNAQNLFEIEKGEWKDWEPLLTKKGYPHDFPLQSALPLPPNVDDYLLFADRPRWPAPENTEKNQ